MLKKQEPTTLKSNQDYVFTTKPKLLSLTQSENYFFGSSFDKISSYNDEIYLLKFSNFLGVSRVSQTNLYGKYKKVDLVYIKYAMLLNTGFI